MGPERKLGRLPKIFSFFLICGLCAAKPVAAQTWVQLNPTGQAPVGGVSGANAVYSPTGNNMVLFGGGIPGGPQNNATILLAGANDLGGTAAWVPLSPTGQVPPARDYHTVVYDSVNDRAIVFGGYAGTDYYATSLNDVWVLINATGKAGSPSWTELSPTGSPAPSLFEHTAVYDPTSNRMIVFGGRTGSGASYDFSPGMNETWVLTNANGLGGTPEWVQLQPSGSLPPGRNSHTAVYDPASNRMIVFGGLTNGGQGTILNDTWVLTNANGLGGTPTWIQLNPSTTIPGRFDHTAVYDPSTNRMIVFSGGVSYSPYTETNEVWVLTNANGLGGTPVWLQLSPSAGPPLPRVGAAAVYDPSSNRMTIFGGLTGCSSGCTALNDVWVLTNANGAGSSGLGITQVLPNEGGNAGQVTVQIIGNGFVQGDRVALVGAGGASIAGTNLDFISANLLTATFDLTQATPDSYDVVVTPPTGTPTTLAGGFKVQEGGAPNIWVDIIGRSTVRFGQPSTFYLVVGNSGTVDSQPGLVSLSIPSALPFTQTSGSRLYAAGSTSDSEYLIPGTAQGSLQSVLFATPGVPAGQTQTATVQLTLPSGAPSDPTITVGWQQDLTNMSLNQFLGLEGIPFISYPASCSQCLDSYAAELAANTNVLNAYFTWQNAKENADLALAKLPISIGETIAQAAAVESLGVGTLGTIAVSALISEGTQCISHFFGDSADCLTPLDDTLGAAKTGLEAALGKAGSFTETQTEALGALDLDFDTSIAAIGALGEILEANGSEKAALATFEQSLGPYTIARRNYQACLSQCGSPPPSPPPAPLPPGTSSLTFTGVTSIDPNAKVGTRGAGAGQFISGVTPLRYTIDFGNEDTATAPAQQVAITDQLDTTNDSLGTLALGPMSFGTQLITPPPFQTSFSTTLDLRPAADLLVAVSGNLNPSTGLLTWNFQSLDPSTGQPPTDPTVGFLPPGGNGSVFFTVMPKPALATGTQINNQATVVFDQNAPIVTPTWLNTLDNTPPSSSVSNLPSTESCSAFQVVWSGTDVGSGIKDFTIFVSDNGGAFAPWLTNTPATSVTYAGQPGHTYAFYSIAEDGVGNVEASKNTAEAATETSATPACGRPSLSGSIIGRSLSGTTLTVTLKFTDTGTGDARNVQISDFRLRVLTGTGTVNYEGSLPISVGNVAIGAASTLTLTFNVPSAISRFVLTEDGTLQDVPGNTYNFSIGQLVLR